MKKTITTLTLLIISGVILLSLTGCGAILNGDKQLTDADLSSGSSTPGSNTPPPSTSGVSASDATLQLKLYYLTSSSYGSTLFGTFTPFSSSYGYLFPLQSSGSYSYSLMGGANSSSNTYREQITSPSYGYKAFTTSSTYDAYIIGYENSSSYSLDAFSNIVTQDDIITFSVNSDYYGSYSLSEFTDYCYCSAYSSSLSTATTKPTSSSSYYSSSYCYLWVELDDTVWISLGSVSY